MALVRSLLIELAQAAGKIARDHFERVGLKDATSKGARDYVSHVDRLIEDGIVNRIRRRHPEHCIIAEEGTAREDSPRFEADRPSWIIDPLDGTSNFLHGIPMFAISIGFCDKGSQLRHSIVYDPIRNEQFIAERDAGLWLGDQRMYTSGHKTVEGALLATGFPFRNLEPLPAALQVFSDVQKRCDDHRRGGCASLDLAYVAIGRLDGYYELGIHPWDTAAGELLIRCGGGQATDFFNHTDKLETRRSLVAGATPDMHAELLACMGPLRDWAGKPPYAGYNAAPRA